MKTRLPLSVVLVLGAVVVSGCGPSDSGMAADSGQPDDASPSASVAADPLPARVSPSPNSDGATVAGQEPSSAPVSAPESATIFATADRMPLAQISEQTRAYAYHESMFDTAVPLRPTGKPRKIDHPQFDAPQPTAGPKYIVMASRGRPTRPTTGVDIVMSERATVLSPVNGKVVNASDYLLYCETPDKRLAIVPDEAPDSRVVLFHFSDLAVSKGQRVEAGVTELGRPRIFEPHNAQYDQYVPGDLPHIHLEVEDEPVAPIPGCRSKVSSDSRGQADQNE